MNGVHDMGGMHGFGKVEPEKDEPPFHAGWEGRVLAMQRAMTFTGEWNIDMSRAAQERLPALAEVAMPAVGHEAQDDAVAGLDHRDALADRLHGARALVAEHGGERDRGLALLEM